MITRTGGFYIINRALFVLSSDQVVSHPSDAEVEVFGSAEEAENEHQRRYPDQYVEEE